MRSWPDVSTGRRTRPSFWTSLQDAVDEIEGGEVALPLAGIEGALGAYGVGKARVYADVSAIAADNIPAINAALVAVSVEGGGEVLLPTHKQFPIRPSVSNYIQIPDNCRLNLGDARLQVASDSPAYTYLISATGGPTSAVSNVSIVGGEIDQNPAGHILSNAAVNGQYCVLLYNAQHVLFDGVNVITCGSNAVAVNGSTCADVRVNGNTFTFTKDNATAYDNSAVYLHALGIEASGNQFYSQLSEQARGCIEIHGPLSVAHGNRSQNYWTLFNLVSSNTTLDAMVDRYLVDISGNVGYGLRAGITIWPRTGSTYRGVSINDNQLYIVQKTGNWKDASGVAFVAGNTFDGDVEGLHITNNQITFETGDTRTVDSDGTTLSHANTHAIHTGAHSKLSDAQIKNNTIVNAPLNGIYLGNTLYSGAEHENVLVEGNLQVNTGNNRSLHRDTRCPFVLAGKFTNTRIRNNPVIVANADGTSGDPRYVYMYGGATSGGGNVFEGNDIIVNGGYTLAETDISSIFSLRRSAAATTLGTVVKKQQVFDRYGVSLGYVPIYDAIT